MDARSSGVRPGAGDSSSTFWCRRCMLHTATGGSTSHTHAGKGSHATEQHAGRQAHCLTKNPAAIAIVHAGRQESRDARRHNKPHAPRRQPLRPYQSSSGMRTSPHGALQTSGGGRWLPAVPLKQMHRVAVHVAEHLELHVARLREVPAQVAGCTPTMAGSYKWASCGCSRDAARAAGCWRRSRGWTWRGRGGGGVPRWVCRAGRALQHVLLQNDLRVAKGLHRLAPR
jgi:hypothetical protein